MHMQCELKRIFLDYLFAGDNWSTMTLSEFHEIIFYASP